MNLKRTNRYFYLRIKRLRGDPGILAGGTAIGVLIGLTPTMPLHTILVIGLTLLTRTSTIAGVVTSVIVCNPLTYFPIYYLAVKLGNIITPYEISWPGIKTIIEQLIGSESLMVSLKLIGNLGYETIAVMLAGGFFLAVPFAIISYYLALYYFENYSTSRK